MSRVLKPLEEKDYQQEVESVVDELAYENFLWFLLEKWLISSGDFAGQRFQLKDSPALVGIVQDDHPFKVCLKSAQSRLSEIHIAEAIWRVLPPRKGNVLYTFPAGEQLQQFVDARPRNAMLTNEFLRKHVSGSLNLKKFGIDKNQIYWRGVQKRRQMISVDASSIYEDEIDVYEEGVVEALNKRLGATKNPIKRYFSTPSFHGQGISLYYYGSESQHERGSDQRVWTIRCESCGQWNEDLLWPQNILDLNERERKSSSYRPNIIVICRHCKKPLNRLSTNAEWVATVEANSDYCHGYHISKLFIPNARLNEMYDDSLNPVKEQEFYNSDLGLPYEPKGSKITDAALDAIHGDYRIHLKTNFNTYIGVDIGPTIHTITGYKDENNKLKVVNIVELDDWHDLDLLYKDMNCCSMVIDMNPEKEKAIDFQNTHARVLLAYFSIHLERTREMFKEDAMEDFLAIHRTLMMILVSDLIFKKQVILPMDSRRVRDFYEQMKAPTRAEKQDAKGDWITFYPKTKQKDHYYFAFLYFLCAVENGPKSTVFQKLKSFMK